MQLISQTEFNRMDFIEVSRVRRPASYPTAGVFLFCFVFSSFVFCFFPEDGHSRRVSIVVSTQFRPVGTPVGDNNQLPGGHCLCDSTQ